MTPLKWFYGFLKKQRAKIILGLVLTTFISALAVINPQISGSIIDDVILGGNYDKLTILLIALIACTALRSILRFFYQLVFEKASQSVLYEMRDKVYRKLLQEDFAFYNKNRTGDLMSRQTGDMDAVILLLLLSIVSMKTCCSFYWH